MIRCLRKMLIYLMVFSTMTCSLVQAVIAAPAEGALPPKGFEKVAENDRYILYANMKEAEIAVRDKVESMTWFSNPTDKDNDTLAFGLPKMSLYSQLIVTYVDEKNSSYTVSSKGSCVNRKGLSSRKVDNGIEFTMDFVKEEFKIPVRYTLEKDYLKAEILTKEIDEYSGDRIISIGLLPYLGAGGTGDNGYILVPDGSGALIYFNNGKVKANEYSEPVYGYDPSIVKSYDDTVKQPVRLPVFGIKNNDDGVFAIIAKNESQAVIKANVSGRITTYNNVYPQLQFRSMSTVELPQKDWKYKDVPTVERVRADSNNFEVRYYFLGKQNSDYSSMACLYRDFLIEEKGLKAGAKSVNIPMYLDLYGYIKKKKPILGIPFQRVIPLTTFDDCRSILDTLNNGGIDNVKVRFNGWLEGAYLEKMPKKAVAERKLGGGKGLLKLLGYTDSNGNSLFLNVDFVNIFKTGNGFNRFRDPSMNMINLPAMQYMYRLGVYEKDNNFTPWYLLSPDRIMNFFDPFLKSYKKLGAGGISLDSLGSVCYSNFRINGLGRWIAPVYWEQALSYAGEQTGSVMVDGGNAYSLPYANDIVNIPDDSSRFDVEDETVPFYQMVLHGLVSYTGPAINLSSNPGKQFLKCLETGSSPHYSWVARNAAELRETRLEFLYSSNYKIWLDSAVEDYKRINSVLSKVADQFIVSHQRLADGLFRTIYGNGVGVIVNYNGYTCFVDGTAIKGNDYVVFREGW